MKPYKGEIHGFTIRAYPRGYFPWESEGGVPYHGDFVLIVYGYRSSSTYSMHTSPVVEVKERPRHNGEPRQFDCETENSMYLLVEN